MRDTHDTHDTHDTGGTGGTGGTGDYPYFPCSPYRPYMPGADGDARPDTAMSPAPTPEEAAALLAAPAFVADAERALRARREAEERAEFLRAVAAFDGGSGPRMAAAMAEREARTARRVYAATRAALLGAWN